MLSEYFLSQSKDEYGKDRFILRTPRTRKVFATYDQAKSAFNAIRKTKDWILFNLIEEVVYVNKPVANKECIVTNKI